MRQESINGKSFPTTTEKEKKQIRTATFIIQRVNQEGHEPTERMKKILEENPDFADRLYSWPLEKIDRLVFGIGREIPEGQERLSEYPEGEITVYDPQKELDDFL